MTYTNEIISEIVNKQKEFFLSGKTLDVKFRIEYLKKLKDAVIRYESEIEDALNKDLNRSKVESYLCDIGPTIIETNEAIKNVKKWARPEKHYSGLLNFPSITTKVYKMPYGVSLIISPFNFPILLTLSVLVASLAAGNTAVIKTSSKSKACTEVLGKIVKEVFPVEYVTLIDGGHDVADMCLSQRFDKIFYTGSPNVGKHVLEMAAPNLTSVALELGGETGNWCIVRKDADIKDAARKIAFFKIFNAGQICININQVAVAKEIEKEFIIELKKAFIKQIGKDASKNEEYPKQVALSAYEKCEKLTSEYKDRVIFGGTGDKETLRFNPTIIYPVKPDEDIVMHELFCPLLPIVPFEDDKVDEIIDIIERREHPLALYFFTKDTKWAERKLSTMQFGGGCINEVCVHMMVKGVPFNGTGHSGMGAYHGEWGFREFTHPTTILKGSTKCNLPLREHPYGKDSEKTLKFLRKFEK